MKALRSALRSVTPVTMLFAAGCTMPFVGGEQAPEATLIPTEAPATQLAAEPSPGPPTETVEPTLEPLGDPIPHLAPGQLIVITSIRMASADFGWAIGGVDGASNHVLRTRDGGTTWQDITPPEPAPEEGKSAVGFFQGTERGWVVYYALAAGFGENRLLVWSTQDAGESWQPSQPVSLDFLGSADYPPLLVFADAQHGWLLARDGPSGMHRYSVYLLRTEDGGRHWATIIDPYEHAALQSCHKTALVFADAQNGWASYDNCPITAPEVSATHDGGQTWQPLQLPPPTGRPTLFETDICEAYSPRLLSPMEGAVSVRCTTGDRLNYFYFTEDGGETWQSTFFPGGSLELINRRTAYALDRKIHHTVDGGRTWDWVKTVQWDGQFSFVTDQLAWAVARSDRAYALVKTSNGGLTWDILKPRIGP